MLITGCDHSTGEYQGIKYDNYILYSPLDGTVFGSKTKSIKIRKKLLDDWLVESHIDDIKYIQNMDLEFYYDQYGRVNKIEEMVSLKKK